MAFRRISNKEIEQLLKKPGRYGLGDNLWLFAKGPTAASFILRYTACDPNSGARKTYDFGLGSAWEYAAPQDGGAPVRRLAIVKARAEAARLLAVVKAGGNPKADRDGQKRGVEKVAKRPTFRQAAEKFLELNRDEWKGDKYSKQIRSAFETFAYERIGHLPVDQISKADVVAVLEPIWHEKRPTADKLQNSISQVMNWAKGADHLPKDSVNPADKGALKYFLPKATRRKQEHHAAMPYQQVPDFMRVLDGQSGFGALALKLLILTACRTNEVLGAKWTEIDREAALWTVPVERLKAGASPHRVPLSPQAMAVLDDLEAIKTGDYLFPGQGGRGRASSMLMLGLIWRLDRRDTTVHGFRTSFRTWGQEYEGRGRSKFDFAALERCLAHEIGNAVSRAYARSDLLEERREIMTAWGAHCVPRATVIALREVA